MKSLQEKIIYIPKKLQLQKMSCSTSSILKFLNSLTPMLFALFAFAAPLSPSLRSIFLILALISVVLNPEYNRYLGYAFNSCWGRAALLLVGFVALACLWSPASFSDQLSVLGKYSKILYLPLFAVGFINPKTRRWCVNAYLTAMVLTCIIALLKAKGIIPPFHSNDVNKIFYNHIITGFMMAYASYLAALEACKVKGKLRMLYLFIVLITSYQLFFLNTGRTGYAIYFIVMGVFCLQKFSFKKALIGLGGLAALMLIAYSISPTMQTGIHNLITDAHSLNANNANSSLGFRIHFHEYAYSLFLRHPIIGLGTGGFQFTYDQERPIIEWGHFLNDPHSQYWLTLSEQGMLGGLLFLFFLSTLFWTALKLKENKHLVLGILFAFCFDSFFDSILCYSIVGYLLILFSALGFGELIEQEACRRKVHGNELR